MKSYLCLSAFVIVPGYLLSTELMVKSRRNENAGDIIETGAVSDSKLVRTDEKHQILVHGLPG